MVTAAPKNCASAWDWGGPRRCHLSGSWLHHLHLGLGGRAQAVLRGANLEDPLIAEQRILIFLVLHLPFMIQIHGFGCREHSWTGDSVHLRAIFIYEFPVLCLEFLRENLSWLLLCWVQGSCQKSALDQDLQLGPAEQAGPTIIWCRGNTAAQREV